MTDQCSGAHGVCQASCRLAPLMPSAALATNALAVHALSYGVPTIRFNEILILFSMRNHSKILISFSNSGVIDSGCALWLRIISSCQIWPPAYQFSAKFYNHFSFKLRFCKCIICTKSRARVLKMAVSSRVI